MVDGLADVVEQAAHLRDLDVATDLGRDDGREMARLDDVVEHVLPVAGPELEPPKQFDQVGGEARHAGLVRGRLAGLAHHELDLGARLRHDLLDPAGVDAPVGDELGQGHARDLAAHRVEPAEDDRLGGVVDDQVDASGLLEGADVAALTADDPALHLVVREVDDAHGVLGGVVGGHPLHRRDDDVAGLLIGLVAGLALDRAAQLHRVVLGLFAHRLEQEPLGIVRGQA